MATQPTQDAVPSESPRDLKFNAGRIDEFVTSFVKQYIDRFGNAHYTIEGLKQLVLQQIYNLGWSFAGSFQDGGTVTSAGDLLQDESTNIWYRWDDLETLPKTVPEGSTPATAGGVGEGKWQPVDVSDVLRKQLAQDDGMKLIGQKVNYGIPSGSSLTRGLIWAFDKIKGWLRVGGSDLEPLDDEKNYWRGLPSKNSWGDPANIGDYSISFGRNGASFAVYTVTLGHDCVTYGVASLAGGAGSATGNPDDITSPNGEGYCSFAYGKNVIALGSKSAAFCEEVEANSRASFAAGYFTQAREGLTSDPGGVASDGIGATALGYSTRAAGDGSFAVGRDIQAYGGSVAIGSGINPGNPASNPNAKSVALYSNSVVPGITVAPAGGGVSDLPFVGIHTSYPKEPLDIVMPNGTNAAFRIGETGTARIKLQGTSNSGASLDIASLEWASTNGGSAVGTLKINMNNGAQSIELSADGMVVLKNVKTLAEISGAPAGTIYKDASNFLKIVV
ncbi:hypothetical protein INF83_09450 [Enterobacter cloacae complex sp. P3B]|uniref:tail fiber/spike domain-containing protein n=1 Tax=unclassified Enterobacter cloacae complex TaxID=2757714 RepID=UPI001866499D|nr:MULTISPECIES: hypothetical protein [unclassified Enterobacter cloacae complex]MBE3178237.1 hypothetical protein [Enterobacter cloacae complex sp. P26RS]MBE3434619.1 hypothetical protein [Enterobacter cloacae complex sp. P21RS]MBE3460725.1 hypothetical protein [Enterobacter cloacae complex sp. P21C]MBE3498162.1 hypothetical protein [Enterobacter cloacae complex sp. P2B]MBE3505540.1 hypothetical protein [Enterobacter cloacae complex sp. I11]